MFLTLYIHIVSLAPGNPSFDGFYRTVKMDDKTYTKWGWEISPEGYRNALSTYAIPLRNLREIFPIPILYMFYHPF
jgi:hypothetical protein